MKRHLLCLLPIWLLSQLASTSGCVVREFDQIPVALEICDSIILDNLFVPGGETLQLTLKSGTSVYFRGNTTFGYYEWKGPLVSINGTNVAIAGEANSVLDGQGQLYWDSLGEWGSPKPRLFNVQLHNSSFNDMHILNPPVHCLFLLDSSNVEMKRWIIDAASGDPGVASGGKTGHNTDGLVFWNVTNVVVSDSVVYNQDDCVCARWGDNILIENMTCYGGHGLSISVGFSNDTVEQNILRNVIIRNSVLEGGDNGIHVKTHIDGCEGLLQNVTYENITLHGSLKYGINIQENYRNLPPNSTMPSDPKNNIPIRDLRLVNIVGTVDTTAVPVYILCAEDGCFNWNFNNVSVKGQKDDECNYVPDGYVC